MKKELLILVADVQQEKTLETIIKKRSQSIGIRQITFDIFRHPHKDPGVFNEAAEFIRVFSYDQYDKVLIIFDEAWEGAPGDAAYLRDDVLQRITANTNWRPEDVEVIVMQPELEAWVWADSRHVPDTLRMSMVDIRAMAEEEGYWRPDAPKPEKPKEVFELVLKQTKRPRSSAIFQELASKVSFRGCTDSSFQLFLDTMRRWFT